MSEQRFKWPQNFTPSQKIAQSSVRKTFSEFNAQDPVYTLNPHSQEDINTFIHYLQRQKNDNKESKERREHYEDYFNSVKNYLISILPFALILFIKIGSEHYKGLLMFLFLHGTFIHCNTSVMNLLLSKMLNRGKRLLETVCIISILILNITSIVLVFSEQTLYKSFYLQSVSLNMDGIASLAWVLLLNDFCVIFATMLLKVLFNTILPTSFLFNRQKGECCQLLEISSQFYRCIIPIRPWVSFLLYSEGGLSPSWLCIILFTAYSACKSLQVYSKFKELLNIGFIFISSDNLRSSSGVMGGVINICSVCHQALKSPKTTQCGHTFCGECISSYLDVDKRCPICNTKLLHHIKYRNGSTSRFFQFF